MPISSTQLAAAWRARADRLDAYAQRCRSEGFVHGNEGAEDAELSALEYRRAADIIDVSEDGMGLS